MSNPTRRGFIGTLAAIAAAPMVLIRPAKPLIADQQQLIEEAEEREAWSPCDVDLIDWRGNEMPMKAMYKLDCGYECGDATFAKVGEMTIKNRIEIDVGTMTKSFGPITSVRISGTSVLPAGYVAEVAYERVVGAGDGLKLDFEINTIYK